MIGHSESNAKKGSTSSAAFLVPLAFALMVIVSFFVVSGKIRDNEKTLCDGVAFHAAAEAAAFVERFTEKGSSLKSALEWNPALTKNSIEAISNDILKSQPFIIGVSAAPSAIVKYHFPESGNESLLGHDLLSNPERREALTRAIKLKSAVISGPFESVEGGSTLFVRYPIFASGKLWGFASLTVDFDKMLQTLGMEKNYPGFAFAFSTEADSAMLSDGTIDIEANAAHAKRLLAGKQEVYEGGVSRGFELPGASWNIHVMPSRGWTAIDPLLYLLFLAGLIGSIALYAAFRLKAWKDSDGGRTNARPKGALSALEAAAQAVRQKNLDASISSRISQQRNSSDEVNKDLGNAAMREGSNQAESAVVLETKIKEHVSDKEDQSASQQSLQAHNVFSGNENTPIDIPKRPGREVTFKGPDVKGQLYMPDVLFAGDPSLLFVRAEEKEPSDHGTGIEELVPQKPDLPTPKESPSRSVPAAAFVEAALPSAAISTLGHAQASPPHRQELLFSLEEAQSEAKPSILVVDDSEANRDIVGRMLSLRGYKADFASSGEEALALCATRRYEIIFMDCFMPGMDGYKASAQLRARHQEFHFAIVGMSARIGDQELERCKLSGMDDLLAKPFTLKDLLTHIEKRRG